jgi:hypothetical protein
MVSDEEPGLEVEIFEIKNYCWNINFGGVICI